MACPANSSDQLGRDSTAWGDCADLLSLLECSQVITADKDCSQCDGVKGANNLNSKKLSVEALELGAESINIRSRAQPQQTYQWQK